MIRIIISVLTFIQVFNRPSIGHQYKGKQYLLITIKQQKYFSMNINIKTIETDTYKSFVQLLDARLIFDENV